MLSTSFKEYWDKDAFRRLTEAMRACCQVYQLSQEEQERLEKEREQSTEEQVADEQFADESYPHQNGNDTMLPRWRAEGFWTFAALARDDISRSAWEHASGGEPDYFDHAYERLGG